MKKIIAIIFISSLLIFSASIENIFAESYQDGEYQVSVEALHATKEEASVAADYINSAALVRVQDGNALLTVIVPKDDEFDLFALNKVGAAEQKSEDGSNMYYSFNLSSSEIDSGVIQVVSSYEVPAMDFLHEDVEFRFKISGLNQLKESATESTVGNVDDSDNGANATEDGLVNAEDNPQTGEDGPAIFFGMLILLSGAFVIYRFTKRATSED